jgi:1,3-beta-glucan synthase
VLNDNVSPPPQPHQTDTNPISQQTRLVDLTPSQRIMKFDRTQWSRAFFKTYYEKRSFGRWLVNFNRVWVIHIAVYRFYTSYNSPKIYDGLALRP